MENQHKPVAHAPYSSSIDPIELPAGSSERPALPATPEPERRSGRKRGRLASRFSAFMAGALVVGGLMFAADETNLFSAASPAGAGGAVSAAATGRAASSDTGSAVRNAAVTSLAGTSTISDIVKQASPAVVKIETKAKSGRSGTLQSSGLGSGFIFDKAGYILTNDHVIEGADEIWVTVEGFEQPFQAKLLGSSYDLDLAALKIEGTQDFATLPLGDPDSSQVGDWLVAIGNPYGFDQTVTVGVLSAKERPITIEDSEGTREYKHLLQTDTSINPGNSGGPLLNLNGEVIGINTAVNSQAQGIGFAIPTSTVSTVLESLKNNVAIPKAAAPYIGVGLQDIDQSWASDLGLSGTDGAIITQVERKSPAFEAGLRTYDVIVAVNGEAVKNTEALSAKIKSLKTGDQVKLTTIRSGQKTDVTVTIGDKNAAAAQ